MLIHVPFKISPAYADFTFAHVNQLVVPFSCQVYNSCKHSIVYYIISGHGRFNEGSSRSSAD